PDQCAVVTLDMESFKPEVVAMVESHSTSHWSYYNYQIEVAPDYLLLMDHGQVRKYDRKTKQWSRLDVPDNEYKLTWLTPHLFLSFGGNPRAVENGPQVGSGIYRADPRTDRTELLASSRRRPT